MWLSPAAVPQAEGAQGGGGWQQSVLFLAQVAAEEAKAALAEKGIVAPEAAAPEEAAAEASLMEKIKAALPKSLSKVFGDDK